MTKIDLQQIRDLRSAASAAWEYRNSGQVAYDTWNEEYAGDQMPRLLAALGDLVQLAQATVDCPGQVAMYFEVVNR